MKYADLPSFEPYLARRRHLQMYGRPAVLLRTTIAAHSPTRHRKAFTGLAIFVTPFLEGTLLKRNRNRPEYAFAGLALGSSAYD